MEPQKVFAWVRLVPFEEDRVLGVLCARQLFDAVTGGRLR